MFSLYNGNVPTYKHYVELSTQKNIYKPGDTNMSTVSYLSMCLCLIKCERLKTL